MFFNRKVKNPYDHVKNLKRIRIASLKSRYFTNDYIENYDTSVSVKKIVYKSKYEKKRILAENLSQLVETIKSMHSMEDFSIYLVEMNDINNQYNTLNQIERKIIRTISENGNINLTIHEILNNNTLGDTINISGLFGMKNTIYNFVIMVDGRVCFISNFFCLISFKQFSKRKNNFGTNNAFISKMYTDFMNGTNNDFEYYMEVLFSPQPKTRKIPKFNPSMKFPIFFYNVNSDFLLNQNLSNNTSVISNDDTLIHDGSDIYSDIHSDDNNNTGDNNENNIGDYIDIEHSSPSSIQYPSQYPLDFAQFPFPLPEYSDLLHYFIMNNRFLITNPNLYQIIHPYQSVLPSQIHNQLIDVDINIDVNNDQQMNNSSFIPVSSFHQVNTDTSIFNTSFPFSFS
ncbi:hypothetical protein BCR36DRAFT_587027 [Piromyces finnis]|uniref:Uncharacterized protein n=1 Tax=Piromyces finnis TaxID=1754191 RepID=A0A1Y1UYN4_9FUNG|nr:hypothetical protein BCR36DRAFT_587027 [Piromyces finnis]|eukprot:ORX42746.1 hypothetical protein BCR36DRAFT_587027 [Piromyces finnis]